MVTAATLLITIGIQNKEQPAATRQKTVKDQFTKDKDAYGHILNGRGMLAELSTDDPLFFRED
jgi:hypothetical protein